MGTSVFPDDIDSFTTMQDISASDIEDVNRYKELVLKGTTRTPAENAELNDLKVTLNTKLFNAQKINHFQNAMVNVQEFFVDNVQGFIETKQTEFEGYIDTKETDINGYVDAKKIEVQDEIDKFDFKGTYASGTQYYQRNVVDYFDGSETQLYMATQDTLGNVPTNTDYFKLLTIKGETGEDGIPGIGIVFKGAWEDSPTSYDKDAGVQYGGLLFASLIDNNMGNEPNINEDTAEWARVLNVTVTVSTLRGQRTIGSSGHTVNFKTGGIVAFNQNIDDLEVYVNSVAVEEGVDYTLNPDNETITRIGSSWNAGTVFYFRVKRCQINDLIFSDGQSIAENTISISKLMQDAKPYISATPPDNPKEGQVWIDIS